MVLGLSPVLFPGLPVPKLRRGLLQFPGHLLQAHDVGRRFPVHDLCRPGHLGLRRLDLPGEPGDGLRETGPVPLHLLQFLLDGGAAPPFHRGLPS